MDLILIIGIPGSGKSTKAREIITQYQANNLPIAHYEADMFFERSGEYKFNPAQLPVAHAWCQKKTEEAMQNNINVIVSNTSLTPKERRIYIELAKIYRYKVQVITMTNEFQNVHGVPPESLERMKKRYVPYDESELYF
jgi:predicted kinase